MWCRVYQLFFSSFLGGGVLKLLQYSNRTLAEYAQAATARADSEFDRCSRIEEEKMKAHKQGDDLMKKVKVCVVVQKFEI